MVSAEKRNVKHVVGERPASRYYDALRNSGSKNNKEKNF